MSKVISPELLKSVVIYEPDTGLFVWKTRPLSMFSDKGHSAEHTCARWNTRYAGKPAFTAIMNTGYFAGSVNKAKLLAHRAAWCVYYGKWPTDEIDHINHVRTDNRIVNLREATRSENAQNNRSHKDSASKYLGVSLYGRDQVWIAQIYVDGEQKYLGRYHNEIDAARRYDRAAVKYFGEFANLNFPQDPTTHGAQQA